MRVSNVLIANFNDVMWDSVTISAYDQYEQSKVFGPAGVTTATLDHPSSGALAYRIPAAAGWNSGNLETVSGGADGTCRRTKCST